MYINAHTTVRSNRLTLVPYSKHHVLQYHEWMRDPEIQAATASEPLSLEQEYAMQESWRRDGDKLTFIITTPTSVESTSETTIDSQLPEDAEEEAIGDVNLFISHQELDVDPQEMKVVGELELMIATKMHRRKGYGRAAVLLFLWYILIHERDILDEYHGCAEHSSVTCERKRFDYFAVKIGEKNETSIRLFESLGFEKVSEEPNYFGEYELRFYGGKREWVQGMLREYEIGAVEEGKYQYGE